MKILLTGGTGLVGKSLIQEMAAKGWEAIILTRDPKKAALQIEVPCEIYSWDGGSALNLSEKVWSKIDGVIHLAGESIAEGAWTPEKKKRIYDSRVLSTRLLSQALRNLSDQKRCFFISASAVGIYGNQGDALLTEDSLIGDDPKDFLAGVCRAWEKELFSTAAKPGGSLRTVALRLGMILSNQGGVLPQILLPFKMGLGGKPGNGLQWMSWIYLQDVVQAILFVAETETLAGLVNVTSPQPVRSGEFSKTLAKVLKRPAVFTAPPTLLKWVLGEKACLLLGGQRVLPERLLEAGFKFQFYDLEALFVHILCNGKHQKL